MLHVYMCICLYIYIYIHTYIHTYIYTHTHKASRTTNFRHILDLVVGNNKHKKSKHEHTYSTVHTYTHTWVHSPGTHRRQQARELYARTRIETVHIHTYIHKAGYKTISGTSWYISEAMCPPRDQSGGGS
jgi:hypothetical protein